MKKADTSSTIRAHILEPNKPVEAPKSGHDIDVQQFLTYMAIHMLKVKEEHWKNFSMESMQVLLKFVQKGRRMGHNLLQVDQKLIIMHLTPTVHTAPSPPPPPPQPAMHTMQPLSTPPLHSYLSSLGALYRPDMYNTAGWIPAQHYNPRFNVPPPTFERHKTPSPTPPPLPSTPAPEQAPHNYVENRNSP